MCATVEGRCLEYLVCITLMMSQKYFDVSRLSKTDKIDFFKSHCETFFCIFLQSPHQVDMKNVIECQKHFFAYFNALEARSDLQVPWSSRLFN